MRRVCVKGVAPCQCADHVRVLLHDSEAEQYLQVRVDAAVGRAMLAELNGLASPHGEGVDLLNAVFAALGASAERLILICDGRTLFAELRVRGEKGEVAIHAEPCNALLAACRMKIPIYVGAGWGEATSGEQVPAVYQPFLETLDLDGLGPPGDQ